ncbi:MAG: S8 family serine peptidase [Candidatus Pristimantibacillus sp.]
MLENVPSSLQITSCVDKEGSEVFPSINAEKLWKEGIKGKGSVVAIIDGRCQINNPDMNERIIGGMNFVSGEEPSDYTVTPNHGFTHITESPLCNGVIGSAPLAKLLVLKVTNGQGTAFNNDVIRAIFYAIYWRGHGGERVGILTISLRGSEHDPMLQSAIKLATSHHILVVVSTGMLTRADDSGNHRDYPEIVSVGAIDEGGCPSHTGNLYSYADIYAIDQFLFTSETGHCMYISGPAVATAHVAGAAALLLQALKSENREPITTSEMLFELKRNTVTIEPNMQMLYFT